MNHEKGAVAKSNNSLFFMPLKDVSRLKGDIWVADFVKLCLIFYSQKLAF